jgi:hypothetical protein
MNLLPSGNIESLGQERADPKLQRQDTAAHDGGGWKATINREGRVAFNDKPPMPWSFDLTDLVMKLRGETLNRPKKKQFLEDTKALRSEMARDVNKENLAQSVIDLRSRLEAVWDNQHLTVLEKKRQLFAMWDDCTEDGSDDVVNTSSLIRTMIISFISHHLPHGSEHAYSKAELETFNSTRQSQSVFAPYGDI